LRWDGDAHYLKYQPRLFHFLCYQRCHNVLRTFFAGNCAGKLIGEKSFFFKNCNYVTSIKTKKNRHVLIAKFIVEIG